MNAAGGGEPGPQLEKEGGAPPPPLSTIPGGHGNGSSRGSSIHVGNVLLGLQHHGHEATGDDAAVMKALQGFRQLLDAAKHVVVLTGAGISAESGIPTFRGEGGLWRRFRAQELATPQAFKANPGLVWEFYHHRREVVSRCRPNDGHLALAALQRRLRQEERRVDIITQNIDRLHQATGSPKESVLELHGSLWLLKPVGQPGFLEEAGKVWEDRSVPLAPCFVGRCQPDPSLSSSKSEIPLADLPHDEAGRLLRPAVVWFNESLDDRVLDRAHRLLEGCDLMLVVGTSSVVYPAAGFAELVAGQGKPVVEINLEATDNSDLCVFAMQGKAGELLPSLLGVEEEVAELRKEAGLDVKEHDK